MLIWPRGMSEYRWYRLLGAMVVCLVALVAAPQSLLAGEKIPPQSRLMQETIDGVFRMSRGSDSGSPAQDDLQAAIQPLLFAIYRSHDKDTDAVLIDLSSYYLGEANGEIFDCILLRRGIASPVFAAALAKGSDRCAQQLGRGASLCRTPADRSDYLRRMRAAIRSKEQCELEY